MPEYSETSPASAFRAFGWNCRSKTPGMPWNSRCHDGRICVIIVTGKIDAKNIVMALTVIVTYFDYSR
jgi:hypothetical protein